VFQERHRCSTGALTLGMSLVLSLGAASPSTVGDRPGRSWGSCWASRWASSTEQTMLGVEPGARTGDRLGAALGEEPRSRSSIVGQNEGDTKSQGPELGEALGEEPGPEPARARAKSWARHQSEYSETSAGVSLVQTERSALASIARPELGPALIQQHGEPPLAAALASRWDQHRAGTRAAARARTGRHSHPAPRCTAVLMHRAAAGAGTGPGAGEHWVHYWRRASVHPWAMSLDCCWERRRDHTGRRARCAAGEALQYQCANTGMSWCSLAPPPSTVGDRPRSWGEVA
jgi:hypothetical protein